MRKFKVLSVAAIAGSLLWCGNVSGAVHYVRPDGGHDSPFDSWAKAATNIQAAVDVAAGDTTIYIAPGIYTAEGTGTSVVHIGGARIPVQTTFTLKAGLPPGVLSGEVVLDGEGVNRGLYLDLDQVYNDRYLVLDGLVIRNGYTEDSGGAVGSRQNRTHVLNVEIRNCTMTNNFAGDSGGAVYLDTTNLGSLIVSNSVINYNEADIGYGGALYLYGNYTPLTVIDSEMSWNMVTNGVLQCGGAIYFSNSSTLNENQLLVVKNSRFIGNEVDGTYNASSGGGAIFHRYGYTNIVQNSLFAGNSSVGYGTFMAMYYHERSYFFDNCTFVDNASPNAGSVIHFRTINRDFPAVFHLRNSILYGGNANLFKGGVNSGTPAAGSDLLVDHCCLPVDYAGTATGAGDVVEGGGNITDPPLFVDQEGGDYRLAVNSPCIDAGENLAWMEGARDLDGKPRIDRISGVVDMGAFEYTGVGSVFLVR